jgi:dephospho-CoA kinase
MKIIALAGLIGSGKDSASEYIEKKYGYFLIHYSNILREICRKEGLEVTRDNLQNIRVKYGNTFLAEEVVKRMKASKKQKILIEPLRRSEDFEIPKKEFGKNLVFILIDVEQKTRFERLKKRGRENDPKDFKEFQRQEKRESEIYDFDKTFSYADHVVSNNGTPATLKKEIDKVMKKI